MEAFRWSKMEASESVILCSHSSGRGNINDVLKGEADRPGVRSGRMKQACLIFVRPSHHLKSYTFLKLSVR